MKETEEELLVITKTYDLILWSCKQLMFLGWIKHQQRFARFKGPISARVTRHDFLAHTLALESTAACATSRTCGECRLPSRLVGALEESAAQRRNLAPSLGRQRPSSSLQP